MLRSSRAITIARSVPSLWKVFEHALHTSTTLQAGGQRTIQRRPLRPARPQYGLNTPRQANTSPPSTSYTSPSRPSKPSIPGNPKASQPPTTSHRLASLPSSHPRSPLRDTPPHLPPKYPTSQPFRAPTYDTPKTQLEPYAASPKPFSSFDLYTGLIESVTGKYGKIGKTTAIQSLSLGHFVAANRGLGKEETLRNRNGERVLLGAETGSGKTLAYLLPLFHHLKLTDTPPSSRSTSEENTLKPRSIILSPTHELTRQSTGVAKSLCHTAKLSVMGLSSTANGGIGDRTGILDVLLGTGGSLARSLGLKKEDKDDARVAEEDDIRLKEIKAGRVSAEDVEWIVVDETDVLLGE